MESTSTSNPPAFVIAALVTALFCGSLNAAAPRVIMIYGGSLERPVVLTDWNEIMRLLQQVGIQDAVIPSQLADRPFFNVSLFWGPQWNRYIESGQPLTKLRPEQASQHGRFYPAIDDARAVLVQTPAPSRFESTPVPPSLQGFRYAGVVSDDALRVLETASVPVRIRRR